MQPCENNAELLKAFMTAEAESARQSQQMISRLVTQFNQRMQEGQNNMMQIITQMRDMMVASAQRGDQEC